MKKMGCLGTLLMWTIGLPIVVLWKLIEAAAIDGNK